MHVFSSPFTFPYSRLISFLQPPFGDVDDRIRAIANGLGLKTIIWRYDSFDWEVSGGAYTPDQVNANYQGLIDNVNNGTFDQVRKHYICE